MALNKPKLEHDVGLCLVCIEKYAELYQCQILSTFSGKTTYFNPFSESARLSAAFEQKCGWQLFEILKLTGHGGIVWLHLPPVRWSSVQQSLRRYGIVGFNVPLDIAYRWSFRRRFYGSDNPTNSIIALKVNGQSHQAQLTKRLRKRYKQNFF